MKNIFLLCALAPVFLMGLTSCGELQFGDSETPNVVVTGMVVDGPVAGASLTVYDAGQNLIGAFPAATNAQGQYRIELPPGTTYPVEIVATEGIDTIANITFEGEISAILSPPSAYSVTLNISPVSTLISHLSKELVNGNALAISDYIINQATTDVVRELGLSIAEPVSSPISGDDYLNFLAEQQKLAEAIRRAAKDLNNNYSLGMLAVVYEHIAGDLSDQYLDGNVVSDNLHSHDLTTLNFINAYEQVQQELATGNMTITHAVTQDIILTMDSFVQVAQ